MVEIESQVLRFTSGLSVCLLICLSTRLEKAGVLKKRSAILVAIAILRNYSLALSYNGERLASRV